MSKLIAPTFDYSAMTKDQLVKHCTAYAEGLHQLTDECTKLRWRLQLIEKHRTVFNGLWKQEVSA